ncbi:MAG: Crp/Fnr family transcriptional regulator [Sandaracinaceae bacterium]|nr:Crp/Fnr family transcriptional regulator [Sandaracinaceae bacterium]MDW8247105.1 Crp/Fnr family transcriptional regulator [Sandaracinaceae bacterium]
MHGLGQDERHRLFERFGQQHRSGQIIYTEGSDAQHCYLIHSGRVRLTKKVGGTEHGLLIVRGGGLFGEEALLPNTKRNASAMALSDVQLLALDRATLLSLFYARFEVALRFMEQLIIRIRLIEEQLENAWLQDPPLRVLNTLIHAASASEGKSLVNLSPMELASRAGIDVDMVKRTVLQLREAGYLRIAGEEIEIEDLQSLQELFELLCSKHSLRDALGGHG